MQKVGRFVTNRDVFGSAISLTFDGRDRYQTFKGGLVTLIFYAAVIW